MSNQIFRIQEVTEALEPLGFSIGGNWSYEGGSYDCPLNDDHTLWLRIPFKALENVYDNEVDDGEGHIRLLEPIVLKHVYCEGNDKTAGAPMLSAVVNQFQAPANVDAELSADDVGKARHRLAEAERRLG
ncbi:YugN family protein [Paenibacillus sp. 481]|uniref:YugN family protein n=1 Tax=Paenibacillus sp. 481 TaxID=2835869 RepID=UPI001E36E5D5|nr:YugN family protein [Paenibacillus sp. 481]UHA72350.1 hypothetical protein KIK04_16915 [Paenibacillus sp. 481]